MYLRLYSCFILLSILSGCGKKFDYGSREAAVNVVAVDEISETTARVSARINTDKGVPITERGVCYAISDNPTIAGNKVKDPDRLLGDYDCSLTNLLPGTVYYARAYATNSLGTAYSSSISWTTKAATFPILSGTIAASQISPNSAASGGIITHGGSSAVTARGVCYSTTTTTPIITSTKTNDGGGTGQFTSNLTNLTPNKLYYIRAYATNSSGTGYGDVKTFTTASPTIPTGVTTSPISSISFSTATGGGNVAGDGGSSITAKGVCWSNVTSLPTTSNSKTVNGTGLGIFSSDLSGLLPNTTYYVRGYATNSVGTAYGASVSFTTTQNFTVGVSYQGGIIAYVFTATDPGYVSGQTHGLIATSVNQSSGAQWGCSGVSIATNTSLGSGQANTISIVSSCTTTGIAARLCNDLVSGGYSDWYLPSKDELAKIYLNRTSIGGFNSGSYWSSTQSSSTTSWSLDFTSGVASSSSSKTANLYVRAIRRF
jgi:hypothetical protein